MLVLRDVKSGYGGSEVLHDVNIRIDDGKITAIIGPNGAGKTTLLKTILKMVKIMSGEITFQNQKLGKNTAAIVRQGIGYVPQGANVFPQMIVKEDLQMGGYAIKSKKKLDERFEKVLEIFPALRDMLNQKSGYLSGGQRRMLAIARALMSDPKILMLDEPSIGLDIGRQLVLFEKLKELNQRGLTVILTEQNISEALEISNFVYVLKSGAVALSGVPGELQANYDISKVLFGSQDSKQA